jgi:hypothetical protein
MNGVAALMFFALAPACLAQEFEIGAMGGYGAAFGLSAESAGGGSADTGVKHGAALGIFAGDDMYERVSGEVRYLYRFGDLRVESGGEEATLSGRSHIFNYDFLFHTRPRGERTRPFVAVGAGARLTQGTGVERAFQPLSEFVLLTKRSDATFIISLGGGVKYNYRENVNLRFEVRDYMGPAPLGVLAPAPGASVDGWLHDIVPLVGIAVSF